MTSSRTLSRPKSTIFATAEDRMKRLTHFFSPSSDVKDLHHDAQDAPPTPPLPEAKAATANTLSPTSATLTSRSRAPTLSVSVPSPNPNANPNTSSPAQGQFGDNLAPQGQSLLLTPTSATQPFFPVLQSPAPPFAASSRPGSRGSGFGSRPGTPSSAGLASSGLGGPAAVTQPAEIPRLRKKRKNKFGKKKKDETQPLVWKLATGSQTSIDGYDFGPLLRGEPAKDLWYGDGDTLVYLTARDSPNPKYTSPVFRIHSTPLLFSTLGPYIEDVHNVEHPTGDYNDSNLAPNDLFLAVPAVGQTVSDIQKDDDTQQNALPIEDSQQTEDDEMRGVMYKVYFPVLELDATPKPTPGKKKNKPKHTKEEAEDTLQRFVDARNLFAFLTCGFLVASLTKDIPFDIFSKIHVQLGLYEGEQNPYDMSVSSRISMAEQHLQTYIRELKLDDVRGDDDSIVEALVLGEKWRCEQLFYEGFVHAAGRWEEVKDHPGLSLVSSLSKSRIDRASIDLVNNRLKNIETRIPNFDFPSVWVGEGRHCKTWIGGYDRMRTLILGHMKHVFGAWPPRAGRHGKGGGYTEQGGLNRVVLKRLYDDMCCIYDLVVDRQWIHGERIHFDGNQSGSDNETGDTKDKDEQTRKTMRKIMDEFDTSCVPVQPEMPFCLPRLPQRIATSGKKKKKGFFSKSSKKINGQEMADLLKESYNQDALKEYADNALVKSFMELEREFGSGKTIEDSVDARQGRWVFIYCVLQSLPMVVVDAPVVSHTDGVEYFLCENVKGSLPWEKGQQNKRNTRLSGMWQQLPDGSMVGFGGSAVNLALNPDDAIDTTYRRSHCWEVAEEWRLVVDPDAEGSYEGSGSEIVGYEPDGRPIYAGEYIPGQEVPGSPIGPPQGYNGEYAPYVDQGVSDDLQKLQLEGQQGVIYENQQYQQPGQLPIEPQQSGQLPIEPQQSGPSWAQEARASYYSHPQYHSAIHSDQPLNGQYQYHEMSGELVASNIPLPMSPIEGPEGQGAQNFQIQPFEFDLTPLDIKPKGPTASPESMVYQPITRPNPTLDTQNLRSYSPSQVQSPSQGSLRHSPHGSMRNSPTQGTSRYSPPGQMMRQSSLPSVTGPGRMSPAYSSPAYSNPRTSPVPRMSPVLQGRSSPNYGPKRVSSLPAHSPMSMSPLQMSPNGSPKIAPVPEHGAGMAL